MLLHICKSTHFSLLKMSKSAHQVITQTRQNASIFHFLRRHVAEVYWVLDFNSNISFVFHFILRAEGEIRNIKSDSNHIPHCAFRPNLFHRPANNSNTYWPSEFSKREIMLSAKFLKPLQTPWFLSKRGPSGAVGGKTGKTAVLPRFCKIGRGGGRGGAPPYYGGLSWPVRARRAGGAAGPRTQG